MTVIDTDIAQILQAEGEGLVGIDLFAGIDQPEKPSSAIFVVATGSYQPRSPSLDYSYLTFQVTVRSGQGGKQVCDQRTQAVLTILHGLVNYTINGNRYVQIMHSSGPVSLLEEGTMNPKNILNFNAMRTTA